MTRWHEANLRNLLNRQSAICNLKSTIHVLSTYLSFIRFSHSVFALPFALTGALLAARQQPTSWGQVAWIVVAMVAARSAAMGFNRLVDAEYDGRNPRTAMREIPRGLISRPSAAVFVAASAAIFVGAAAQLSWICLRAVAGGAGNRLLVFAGQALHGLHPGVSRAGDGGGAGGRLAGRWRTD